MEITTDRIAATRAAILAAAESRFAEYGCAKTTQVEVAELERLARATVQMLLSGLRRA
jgi:hypothetical protein